MSNPNQSSSPFVDALKLFFRNPSAVVALLLILGLATAAITGKVFTGPKPSVANWEQLDTASELGDTTELDVNPTAVLDPTKTRLKDTFLPPFSDSRMSIEEWRQELIESTPEELHDTPEFKAELEGVEPKFYVLGTDHLGRDVLAQLWAGSTISLTIGFLAVGIAVLLGVTLGGISGFFGRKPVRLPMLVMLLSALMGGIAMPAEAPAAAYIFFTISFLAFVYQLVVALIGKRHKPVIAWCVVAAIVGGIFTYNWVIETQTPEGRTLSEAREMESISKDVLLMTRDHGVEVKYFENGRPDALSKEELIEDQMELDVAYANMHLGEKRFQFVEYVAGLEIDERAGHEMLERADHLEAHLDESYLKELSKDEIAALSPRESKLRGRHQGRKQSIKELRESGNKRIARGAVIREVIEPWTEKAWEEIDAAEEHMDFESDFDFQSAEARVNKLKDTQQALKRVDRAIAELKFVEHLAAALLHESAQGVSIGDKLVPIIEKAEKDAAARVKSIKESQAGATDDERKQSLRNQLKDAEQTLKQARAALPLARELKKLGKDMQKQLDMLSDFGSENDEGYTGLRAHLADALKGAAGELKERQEKDGVKKEIKSALGEQVSELNSAAGQVSAIHGAEQSIRTLEEDAAEMVKLLTTPEDKRTEKQQDTYAEYLGYDYGQGGDTASRNPLFFSLEPSVKLLNRRAEMRTAYLKKYETEASNRFDGPRGLTQVKLMDGSSRYGVFRITRHFISVTIMLVILLVASMVVAASAQGAAEDVVTPLSKAFIPTISTDDLVMRFTEIMMTIPVIYLILAVLALFERDVYIVMAVIGLTSWMGTTRFVRAEILSLREQDFIQASRALGVSDFRIIWRHLVPNAMSPVLVSATLMVATAVLAESTLSFLGIGAGPDQHTWGQILNTGRAYITDASWLTWIPGVAILITVLSFNLLGEGLREAFNPKLRGR